MSFVLVCWHIEIPMWISWVGRSTNCNPPSHFTDLQKNLFSHLSLSRLAVQLKKLYFFVKLKSCLWLNRSQSLFYFVSQENLTAKLAGLVCDIIWSWASLWWNCSSVWNCEKMQRSTLPQFNLGKGFVESDNDWICSGWSILGDRQCTC